MWLLKLFSYHTMSIINVQPLFKFPALLILPHSPNLPHPHSPTHTRLKTKYLVFYHRGGAVQPRVRRGGYDNLPTFDKIIALTISISVALSCRSAVLQCEPWVIWPTLRVAQIWCLDQSCYLKMPSRNGLKLPWRL